jgi:hypothetical protein
MHLRSGTSRYQDSGLVAAFGIFLAVYAGFAFCFYWLMQPTVVGNRGLAAYHPPPKTVVTDLPWVPPGPLEPPAILAATEPTHEIEKSSGVAPKIERAREARTAPRREPPVRARPNPVWDYASGRSYGFRPWF